MRKPWIVFVSLVAVLGSGCASTSQQLLEHPKAVVRYPAKAGEVAGGIVGIPVGIVLLPVSWTIGATSAECFHGSELHSRYSGQWQCQDSRICMPGGSGAAFSA